MDRPTDHTRATAAFDELTRCWLATLSSPNTRAAYRADLATFGRWCAQQGAIALRADAATIAAFHAAQEAAGHSVSTRRRRWSSLSSFFEFAVEAEAASSNPVQTGGRPRLPGGGVSPTVGLSPDMVEAYLVAAAALDPRLDALVSLIVFDGLKLGEALALDVDDVRGRPPKVALVVRRQGSVRRIQLTARSARAVHRCAGRREGEPLFTAAHSGRPPHRLTRFGADHLLKKVDAAGAASLTANALRRFHVTAHHATGADLDTVRERAGVDDVRTVRRYLAQEAAEIDSTERVLRPRLGDGDRESPVG